MLNSLKFIKDFINIFYPTTMCYNLLHINIKILGHSSREFHCFYLI